MDNRVAVEVKNVSMHFNMATEKIDSLKEYIIKIMKKQLFFDDFVAVEDISFTVKKGEIFGIVGTNGSGKSTLLKMIAGVLKPTQGTINAYGNIAPLIELGAGFDGDLSARENIFLNGAILGYSKKFIADHFDKIVEFAELPDFVDIPIKNYSSGMVARIAFAIATIITPDILIVDEILSVGDFLFQQKCEKRIKELMECGTTILFVSHSIDQVEKLCTRALWIEKSKAKMLGPSWEVCNAYRNLKNQGEYLQVQEALLDTITTEKCWICGRTSAFRTEKGVTLKREAVCQYCGSSIRVSDLALVITEHILGFPSVLQDCATLLSKFKILNCSKSGSFNNLLKDYDNFDCIDFFEINQQQKSPFCELPDDYYDYIISEEILKHFYLYEKEFAQLNRIMKNNGVHFFTVPLHEGKKTIFRHDTKMREVFLPGSNGDRLKVTIDWGNDISQILSQFGFQTYGKTLHEFYALGEITNVEDSYEDSYKVHPFYYYKYNSVPFYYEKINCVRECVTRDRCFCCGSFAGFFSDYGVTLKREATCASCGASLRNSDLAYILASELLHKEDPLVALKAELSDLRILNASSTGVFHNILQGSPKYSCFEYFDNIKPGEYYNGVMCNDLQSLTYSDNSFDVLITEDVLEHVDNSAKVFQECCRVLDISSGLGIHLFTVPIHEGRKTLFREDCRPYTHVDPIRPEGVLVTIDWGDDICSIIDQYGFSSKIFKQHQFYNNLEITNVDSSFEEYSKTHPFYYYKYNSIICFSKKID